MLNTGNNRLWETRHVAFARRRWSLQGPLCKHIFVSTSHQLDVTLVKEQSCITSLDQNLNHLESGLSKYTVLCEFIDVVSKYST